VTSSRLWTNILPNCWLRQFRELRRTDERLSGLKISEKKLERKFLKIFCFRLLCFLKGKVSRKPQVVFIKTTKEIDAAPVVAFAKENFSNILIFLTKLFQLFVN